MSEIGGIEAVKAGMPELNKLDKNPKPTLGQKAAEKLRKLFKRERKPLLEIPLVEMPSIPNGSGLANLVSSLKEGYIKEGMSQEQQNDSTTQSRDTAQVIEKNYFRILRRTEDIPDPKIQDQVRKAVNDGDMRVIAALAQEEYRAVMSQHNPEAKKIEEEMNNKKILNDANDLLKIRSQAALMGYDISDIYKKTHRYPETYWNQILNSKSADKELVTAGNKLENKVNQQIEEILQHKDKPLEDGKREE